MKERVSVDEAESCRKSDRERETERERENRHLKTEEEEEQTYRKKSWGKQRKRYCTDWWMDRTVGGGVRGFLREEESGEWRGGDEPDL